MQQSFCFSLWSHFRLQPFICLCPKVLVTQIPVYQRNINPYLLLLWIITYHKNSFLTRQVTPPHRAIRSWTQLLIAGRLNLVCHQIPVGGRDEDVVQRATRPLRMQHMTPTDIASRKSHWQFPLKPQASPFLPSLILILFSFAEKIVCVAPSVST